MSRESIYRRYVPGIIPDNAEGEPAYWFAFSSGRLLVGLAHGSPEIPLKVGLGEVGITPVRTQYLGTLDDRPCYSAELQADSLAPLGMALNDLRSIHGAIDDSSGTGDALTLPISAPFRYSTTRAFERATAT